MTQYDWPGNIRELENLCKRFVIVGSETQILRELSSHGLADTAPAVVLSSPQQAITNQSTTVGSATDLSLLEVGRRAAWEAERRAIQQMLESTHWNRREASRRLQVSYKALLNKIKQMQLEENASKILGTQSTSENQSTH
jgi:DNA-binding NtrC family response regulator